MPGGETWNKHYRYAGALLYWYFLTPRFTPHFNAIYIFSILSSDTGSILFSDSACI